MTEPGAADHGRGRPGRPRYLLVGGSNCIVREGFGAALQARVPGRWRNESLGASSSLRGAEFLLRHLELVERWDVILFEYALNDIIFEADRTLDPMTHLAVLRALASQPVIRQRLRFVLMRGRHGRLGRERASFVLDHYRRVSAEFKIGTIDLLDTIGALENASAAGTFADADHFTPEAVTALVDAAAPQLAQVPALAHAPEESRHAAPELRTVDPLTDAVESKEVAPEAFRTSLVSARVVRLGADSRVVIRSPGGLLAGFYALSGPESGWLRISHRRHNVLKDLRPEAQAGKTFLAMRHLTTPIPTERGDEMVFRHARDPYRIARSSVDASRRRLMEPGGDSVSIGRIVFLRHRR